MTDKRCDHRTNPGMYYGMKGNEILFQCPDCGQIYRFTIFRDSQERQSICEVEVKK